MKFNETERTNLDRKRQYVISIDVKVGGSGVKPLTIFSALLGFFQPLGPSHNF